MKIKVLFMGRKKVASECLKYLVSRTDVEIVGVLTDSHIANSATTRVAIDNGLQLFDYDSASDAIKSNKLYFDIGLSMLYWRKLKGQYLTLPKLGIINFHPAILPKYKGTAGYNIAILEGRSDWGVSAHYVDAEMDTGEIIDVSIFPISRDEETAYSLEKKSQSYLFDQFIKVVNLALEKKSKLDSVPNIGGKYISRLEMEAMKEIKDGDDISRKIRAFWFPPYDGAFVKINNKKFTLVDGFILGTLSDPDASSLFSATLDTSK